MRTLLASHSKIRISLTRPKMQNNFNHKIINFNQRYMNYIVRPVAAFNYVRVRRVRTALSKFKYQIK